MPPTPLHPPRTTLAASLALCGLAPADAARWLDVEEPLLRDWIAGRRAPPAAVWRMLAGLYGRMTDVALAASVLAGPAIGREAAIPDRAAVNDADDPWPGHGETMAGAMAVLMALGQDGADGMTACGPGAGREGGLRRDP